MLYQVFNLKRVISSVQFEEWYIKCSIGNVLFQVFNWKSVYQVFNSKSVISSVQFQECISSVQFEECYINCSIWRVIYQVFNLKSVYHVFNLKSDISSVQFKECYINCSIWRVIYQVFNLKSIISSVQFEECISSVQYTINRRKNSKLNRNSNSISILFPQRKFPRKTTFFSNSIFTVNPTDTKENFVQTSAADIDMWSSLKSVAVAFSPTNLMKDKGYLFSALPQYSYGEHSNNSYFTLSIAFSSLRANYEDILMIYIYYPIIFDLINSKILYWI